MKPIEIRRREPSPTESLGATVHPVLKRVYAARGVERADDLDLSLERLLPVGSLAGVEAAAELLAAQRAGGRVLVVGDFDADGATASALVVRALRGMGFAHVDFLVPDRFRFGYGLSAEIVALAAERRPTLIVTVDNGISSLEGVAAARAAGIEVLVTDHHLPAAALPRASVIVNPNLGDSGFASPALAGVGVAFYVVAALARRLGDVGFRVADLLDLVALGTVADVVPLDRNNRILVEQGLRRIRAGRCVPGIRALLDAAGRRLARVTAADLGFAVGPRLNAAGRLTDMSVGIACLLTDDPAVAADLAGQLSRLNEERRDIEQRMQAEAIDMAVRACAQAEGSEALGLTLFDPTWHQGVVGLVAGRVKERLHRPVVAFARGDGGLLRGSARSIAGVHVRDVLDSIAARHPDLLKKFGGHAMAAGMTLAEGALEQFRQAFAAEVAARVDASALRGVILSDGELSPGELCLATAQALRAGGPWGQGFPEPVFDGVFRVEQCRVVGERHLKLSLTPRGAGGGAPVGAIAFGHLDRTGPDAVPRPATEVRVAYRLETDDYGGPERAQLNVLHLGLAAPDGARG